MVFSSSLFLFLFLPLFLAVYHLLPFRLRRFWLLAASWVFYGWWRLDFLALILAMSSAAWLLGRWIAASRAARRTHARVLVVLGVALFTGTLAYFKYVNFGIESINVLLGSLGQSAIPLLNIVLPVGISFCTFKAISYLVDMYRGSLEAAGNWHEVALYVAIFPQVISGPIDRYGELMPQLRRDARSFEDFGAGALRFMWGFCKKVLIADAVAPLANAAFALARPSLADSWLGAGAYTVQLYFDFSGYTDMAVGLGLMMGLRFMENFRSPYLSGSITEFWRRWHISLSSWLRDYLYFPLGGNRRGAARTILNLVIVMVLGGLWHGAAVTFVLWGAWHGLLLVIERLRPTSGGIPRPSRPLSVAVTMVLVIVGWVLFRAQSLEGAARMYAGMIGLFGAGLSADFRWQIDGTALAALAAAVAGMYCGPGLAGRLAGLPARWHRAAEGLSLAVIPLFLLGIVKILAASSPLFLYGRF
jgi:alginate O-acetyltransferase complex protein AlgI